jgi:DNA-binding transcriptional regulator YhcF (GntR family)
MTSRLNVTRYLRDHIVGAMHLGHLRGGDRLPSVREMGKQLGRNTRTVRAAYAALEQEGLVEVRGRSGVFIAEQAIPGGVITEERGRWLSGVVAEAWTRRIAVSALPELVQRCTAVRRVRCGLIDQIEDAIVALRYELEEEWGFDVRVVEPDELACAGAVDFFAATSFYAASAHAGVLELGKPLIVLTAHPRLIEAVETQIRDGRLTVVAVDQRFADRMRIIYSPDDPSRVRFVAASDRAAVAALDPQEPVMLTRAAHQKLGTVRLRMIFPHSPTISPDTARILATKLVRLNVESRVQ